jgi:type IV secretion system protein VirD4
VSERTEDTPLLTEDQARRMDLDEVILVIDAQMPIRARRIKYFMDPQLLDLHGGQAGSFPYPDEDRLRRDRDMLETRESVEKLRQELEEVRVARGIPAADPNAAHSGDSRSPAPIVTSRGRGRAARLAATAGEQVPLELNLSALGLSGVDQGRLASAVQTTRAIIAEFA